MDPKNALASASKRNEDPNFATGSPKKRIPLIPHTTRATTMVTRCVLLIPILVCAFLSSSCQAEQHMTGIGHLFGKRIKSLVSQSFKKRIGQIPSHQDNVIPLRRSCAFVGSVNCGQRRSRVATPNAAFVACSALSDDAYVEVFRDDFDTLDLTNGSLNLA